MRGVVFLVSLVVLALAQVAVAPLFPLRAAVPDLALVTVMAVALYWGPQPAMLAAPLMAVTIGLASDRAPGLVVLAYIPVLPLAYFLEDARMPFSRFVQASLATVLGGMAARFLLASGPITQGADFTVGAFVGDLLLPGMLLDWALFVVVYLPLRLAGWQASPMTLTRSGYQG